VIVISGDKVAMEDWGGFGKAMDALKSLLSGPTR
jgi:hypothetical protein